MARVSRFALLLLSAFAMAASCETCEGVGAGEPCLETNECAPPLVCCAEFTDHPNSCRTKQECGSVCEVCGTWTERYACANGVDEVGCGATDVCVDEDVCVSFTFERGDTPGTYVSADGFLVGKLEGRTLTWRGETESDPGVDTGYVEVGTLVFNSDFTRATGSSCYVVDDAFDPELGDTSCAPYDGSPGWQMAGRCTQTLARAGTMPAPPADVGCCVDAPAENDSCND